MLHLLRQPQSASIQSAVSVPSIVHWRKESGSAELCEEPQGMNYPAASYSFFTSCRPWPCYASVSQAPTLASQDDKHLRQTEKVPEGLFIHRRTITEPKGEKLPVNALPSHRGADGKYSVLLERGAETVRSRGCVSRYGESLCKHNCSSVLLNFCHCVLPDQWTLSYPEVLSSQAHCQHALL